MSQTFAQVQTLIEFGTAKQWWDGDFLVHLQSLWDYEDPENLRYSNRLFSQIDSDSAQTSTSTWQREKPASCPIRHGGIT